MEDTLKMTPRERFIRALERKPLKGLVPHFELVFFLHMEVFGKVTHWQRTYSQWDQMTEKERNLHRHDLAQLHIDTAEKFQHSAIVLYPQPGTDEEYFRMIDLIREKSGNKYALLMHGDATFGVPDGNHMTEFSYRLSDDPDGIKEEAQTMVDDALRRGEKFAQHGGLDGHVLCADYCLNAGPFLSPRQFRQFVSPYLTQLIKGYRDMGFYEIKHTDGNIMPILDQLVDANPHALHSIDPQAGVDIAEVKKLVGGKVALCGNVNCGLVETGTEEQAIESTRYALKHGMPGGGYIFSTSNCVYTGMRLERYQLILDVWRKEGIYV